jgi:hypothetical protein
MADVLITIENIQGHFHARDAVVKNGDNLKLQTTIDSCAFTVVISNKDGFFDDDNSLITKVITKADGVQDLVTVSTGGNPVKTYEIFPAPSCEIPGIIEAPPRIIRVT